MSYSEEELQKRAEKGLYSEKTPDEKAYQVVFESLKKDTYAVSPHFADKVISKLEAQRSVLRNDYFWFGVGLVLFVVTTIVVILRSDLAIGSSKFLSGYGGLFIFGIIFVLAIQIVDRQWIRSRLHHPELN